MIRWFWKHRTLMHRLPVLMALLAGFMFTSMPAGKPLAFTSLYAAQAGDGEAEHGKSTQAKKANSGEDVPVYEPGFSALAQVAPLQFFFYQPAFLPVIIPLVEIVEQASVRAPDLVNSFHRILFRRIISPNAP